MHLLLLALALAIGLLGALILLGRWGRNWGSTREERDAAMPGDDWLEDPLPVRLIMTRAVWIDAPRSVVWPWLAQYARGAGWYSYDVIDNGGKTSACHLVSWIPEPRPGDACAVGYLRELDPGHELAWWMNGAELPGVRLRNVMAYRLTEVNGRSRLVMRMSADARGLLALPVCWGYLIGDTIMARRHLLGIRRRAERFGARTADPSRPETGTRDQFQKYVSILACGTRVGSTGPSYAERWRSEAIADGVLQVDERS